ncbi:protein of unknown function [Mesotoga infera]|uniref:Uncharacterized protein n=1 Tax=Mesotoga infera TaxID=1236046 RepID=A0A7Z7LE00_9BACT|nr:protein of unknown function [Mesotoga infera]
MKKTMRILSDIDESEHESRSHHPEFYLTLKEADRESGNTGPYRQQTIS